MSSVRRLLCLVLGALLALGGTLPQRAQPCGQAATGAAAQASCCPPKACCCGTGAQHCAMAPCEGQPQPTPVPAPAPKPLDLGLAYESLPRPIGETPVLITAPHEVHPGADAPRTFRTAPTRLRQEALSVWRC